MAQDGLGEVEGDAGEVEDEEWGPCHDLQRRILQLLFVEAVANDTVGYRRLRECERQQAEDVELGRELTMTSKIIRMTTMTFHELT